MHPQERRVLVVALLIGSAAYFACGAIGRAVAPVPADVVTMETAYLDGSKDEPSHACETTAPGFQRCSSLRHLIDVTLQGKCAPTRPARRGGWPPMEL